MLRLASRWKLTSLLLIVLAVAAGVTMAATRTVHAQAPSHVYEFNGDFTDELGGPDLVPAGGTIHADSYSFGPNQGLSLSNGFADPGSYSIEMVFNFSDLDNWRKILDFENLTAVSGLYNSPGNAVYFYPFGSGPADALRKDTNINLVVTRDATTELFTAYTDGIFQFSFTDDTSGAVSTGPDDVVHFFVDELNGGQASHGVVHRIRIWDGVLSAADVGEHVRITPKDDAASSGDTISFSADSGTGPFTFSLARNSSGGNIDASTGLYSAGDDRGVDIVRVTDDDGGIAEANVNVTGALTLAPVLIHEYEFNGDLTDEFGGPDLVSAGGTVNAFDYSFDPNQGLSLSNGLLNAGNYSIELTFNFRDIDTWRKILDFKDLTSNNGFYNSPGNAVYFYPRAAGPADALRRDTNVHLVATRNATNDEFIVYTDGVQQFSFTDAVFDAIFTEPDDIIQLFNDDRTTSQASAGVVHRIRIWDGVLSAADVAEHVTISPKDDAASSGDTITFSAPSGTAPFVFSLARNSSGGSIDASSGLYTAGDDRGIDIVRVTDADEGISEANVNVTGALTLSPAVIHEYEFNGDLSDERGGPDLVSYGGTVNATNYTFGPNQGLSLSDGLVNSGNYSIEMVFQFSDIDTWRKILDFKNLTHNFGFYNSPANAVYFYPRGAGPANALTADTDVHLVVTRDATTDLFSAYADGVHQFSFTDSVFDAIFTEPDDVIHFFNDDFFASQASSGVVDRIRIYDGALSASQVVDLFNGGLPPGRSPAEDTAILIGHVESLDLPKGTQTSLISTLEAAIKSMEKGKNKTAANQIEAFINKVEAQRGKKIDEPAADRVIASAQRIIDTLLEP